MIDADRLHGQLRSHVGDRAGPRAAVELLIAHGSWLGRPDFVDRFTYTGVDFDTEVTSTGIEWTMAIKALDHGFACSAANESLLRIAASMAYGIPIDLRREAARLDHASATLVVEAFTHTAA